MKKIIGSMLLLATSMLICSTTVTACENAGVHVVLVDNHHDFNAEILGGCPPVDLPLIMISHPAYLDFPVSIRIPKTYQIGTVEKAVAYNVRPGHYQYLDGARNWSTYSHRE